MTVAGPPRWGQTAEVDPSRLFGLRDRTSALSAEAAICSRMAGLAASRPVPPLRREWRLLGSGLFPRIRRMTGVGGVRRSTAWRRWTAPSPEAVIPTPDTGLRLLARSGWERTGCFQTGVHDYGLVFISILDNSLSQKLSRSARRPGHPRPSTSCVRSPSMPVNGLGVRYRLSNALSQDD
jgi:hypothetical protein